MVLTNIGGMIGKASKVVNASCLRYLRMSAVCLANENMPKYKIVKLPSLSPTMETGTITNWQKKVGDKLEFGDIIAEIETDKAVMSLETPYAGYLAKIIIPENTKNVPINKPIGIIVNKKDEVGVFENFSLDSEEQNKSGAKQESKQSKKEEPIKASDEEVKHREPIHMGADSNRLKASPYSKKIARENNVDLNNVEYSGERIQSQDVLKYMDTMSSSPSTSSTTSSTTFTDIELTSMRKTIATRLTQSKNTIPHFYLTIDIEMDNMIKIREQINLTLKNNHKNTKQAPPKISINDYLVKIAAQCQRLVPECNTFFMGDFLRQYNTVDINVAVSTDTGLITPFVRDADKKGVLEISNEVKQLAELAKSKKLKPEQYQGGTMTISNLGMFGVNSFSAIINPPQSVILAVGTTRSVVVHDKASDKLLPKTVMSVTLCCDHRVVDGATGAVWLGHFKRLVENPVELIV